MKSHKKTQIRGHPGLGEQGLESAVRGARGSLLCVPATPKASADKDFKGSW